MSYRWRRLLAIMMRESSRSLQLAAGKGKWAPNLSIVSVTLTFRLWEMMLFLPTIFFLPLAYLLGVLPSDGAVSPGQMDLSNGRATTAAYHLGELVEVSFVFVVACFAYVSTVVFVNSFYILLILQSDCTKE